MKFTALSNIKMYIKHPNLIWIDIKGKFRTWKYNLIYKWRMEQFNAYVRFAKEQTRIINFDDRCERLSATIDNPMYFVTGAISKHCSNALRLGIKDINIDIEHNKDIIVNVTLSHPGNLIGERGTTIHEIENDLTAIFGKNCQINITEWKRKTLLI